MAAFGHFGCPKFTLDRISGHFRSIGHFGFQKLTNKIFFVDQRLKYTILCGVVRPCVDQSLFKISKSINNKLREQLGFLVLFDQLIINDNFYPLSTNWNHSICE